ncbi:MAG TPA: serine hydrolase domain-containing protein, partial [Terricaulis sp.]|nr:serine hydrolase domain-containing protein [Terricaulis sp.]
DSEGAALAPSIREREMNAADDLYTTVGDYARFMLSVMNGEGVSPGIAAQRYVYPAELREGGCGEGEGRLAMEACPDGVGMGLGWMVFRYGDETLIMHTGSDDGEQAIAFFVPERRLGVVIFTNSAHGSRLYPEIVAQLYPNEKFIAFLRMQAAR